MFTAALCTMARTWGSPGRPPADEWVRKPWYTIYNGILLSCKRNAFESVLMRWKKVEPIKQSEVSQKEKPKYCILMHIYGI